MTPAAPRDFTARVLWVVRKIPRGKVATYGDVAAIAGRPGAARAVGNIMRTCGRPDVPAHRVIAAGGLIGGYGGHEAQKRALLIAEGVEFRGKTGRGPEKGEDSASSLLRSIMTLGSAGALLEA